MRTLEKIYNALKDCSLDRRTSKWTVGHVKFYNDAGSECCHFDVLSKCSQDKLGRCVFFMYTYPTTGTIHISFENTDGFANIRPEISVPPSRYILPDNMLGRYFRLLVDNLYYMSNL